MSSSEIQRLINIEIIFCFQFDAHMKLHMHRSCHMCGKEFKRKQNADIHLMGVHGLTKEDLATLGR